jgi:hypothetical protein
MRIFKPAKRVEITHRTMEFRYLEDSGAGFGFNCNERGQVDITTMNDAAFANYRGCLAGNVNGKAVYCDGIREWKNRYTEPGEGRCSCGEIVLLDGFTNTCDRCGADYNYAGQLLAPRSQWGEETGETAADILGVQ